MKSKIIFEKIAMIFVITATVLFLNACVAAAVTGVVAASGATTAYVMGTLRSEIKNATPRQIAEAAKSAFQTLAIKTEKIRVTEVDGLVTGYTANDKKITIKIKRITDKITELTIHVGYFGDEALSELIYNEIIKVLGRKQDPEVETYAVPVESVSMATQEFTPMPAPVMESELESTPGEEREPLPIPEPTPAPVFESEPAPVYPPEVERNSDPYTPVVVEEAEPAATPMPMHSSSENEPSPDAMPIPAN